MSESSALFMPTVVVGAVYAFYLLIAAREAASRKRRQAMLSAAWAAMGSSAADVEAGTVTGVVRGLPTAFCVRGDAATVEIALSPVDVVAIVQPRLMPAHGAAEPGSVRTGDPIFDEVYFVEGAPADILRCLLGPELRARLLGLRPVWLGISGRTLELRGHASTGPSEVAALIDAAATAAATLPRAVALADRQITEITGSPYRPTVDASAVHAAHSQRTAEMAGFMELVRERAVSARRALFLALVLGAILVASLYASGS